MGGNLAESVDRPCGHCAGSGLAQKSLTDTDVKYLLFYFDQNCGLTSEKKLMVALSMVANENFYHPIQDVLNSLVWDGKSRI